MRTARNKRRRIMQSRTGRKPAVGHPVAAGREIARTWSRTWSRSDILLQRRTPCDDRRMRSKALMLDDAFGRPALPRFSGRRVEGNDCNAEQTDEQSGSLP